MIVVGFFFTVLEWDTKFQMHSYPTFKDWNHLKFLRTRKISCILFGYQRMQFFNMNIDLSTLFRYKARFNRKKRSYNDIEGNVNSV